MISKFTKGDPVIPYWHMKEFEKIADNVTQGSRVLIGGPLDGERHIPKDRREFKKLVLPVPGPPLTFKEWEKLDPVAQPPIVSVYWPEILRGHEIEMIFYRHESLSVDQALVLLLARYRGEMKEPTETQLKHQCQCEECDPQL